MGWHVVGLYKGISQTKTQVMEIIIIISAMLINHKAIARILEEVNDRMQAYHQTF